MKHRDTHDIIGGFGLVALGIFVVIYAQQYEFGDLNRMGPGYFPVALGIIITVLGLIIGIPALFREGEKIHIDWVPLFLVIGSLASFALTLKALGIIFATALSVMISSLATEMSWRGRILLGAGIAGFTYLVFIAGLGMILPTWPWSH
jgi:hypothetical protein